MAMNGDVSVVIPVWNGERTIGETVRVVLAQSIAPREVIVIDDGSTDRTSNILEGFGERIRFEKQSNGGPAAARNRGLRLARGRFVAFTDSDCYPVGDWLERLLEGFDSDEIAGTGGIVRSANRDLIGEYVDLIRLLDPLPDASGAIPYLITANACFRREVLLEAGLFDERFRKPGGEEAELCQRIRARGYQFREAPRALVRHEHRASVGSLLKTLANYGEGAAMIAALRPETRIKRPGRLLLRRLIGLRAWAGQMRGYLPRFGWRRALCFSLLDYLRQPAFLAGYLRGEWNGVAGQRHNPLP